MIRENPGGYEVATVAGERVEAFVPATPPPTPPLRKSRAPSRPSPTYHDRLAEREGRRLGSALRMHEALKARPILSLPVACEETGLSFHAAATAMETLARQGIAREVTGKRRGRLYAFEGYLTVLGEGTEPS